MILADDPRDPAGFDHQFGRGSLLDGQTRLCLQQGQNRLLVARPVRLGAWPVHGGSFSPVEQLEMNAGPIRRHAHQTIQRVDLPDEMVPCQCRRWRGLHDMAPIVERSWVSSNVSAPNRAAAAAASHPA